jgi:shikimate dehydrogenase
MKQARIYGLIGNPLQHSLSPSMHNAALASLKIKAKYKLFQLQDTELKPFLVDLAKKNICGLNVTIPYKEKILQCLNGYKTEAVKAIGAANTIVIDKKGRVKFYNTDYLGFTRHLKALKVNPKKVALIGAGGAAKAVCFALAKMKVKEVVIYDVDKFRSLSLVRKFNKLFSGVHFLAVSTVAEFNLGDKDFLVNASPVGMNNDDPLLIDPQKLKPGLFVYDLIYNPAKTKLLKSAEENGLAFSNGLGMLLYQGVEALNLWISPKKAPEKIMAEALKKACCKH